MSLALSLGNIVFAAIIGYAIGAPWAVFYIVAHFLMALLAGSFALRLLTTTVLLGILFYYALPWWYVLIFAQNIARMWVLEFTTKKVREKKWDESKAQLTLRKFGMAADTLFYVGAIGTIHHCFFV